MAFSRQKAEVIAAGVLAWLSADSARLSAFLAATGANPHELSHALDRPDFLLAVLDFLMADEGLLLACCAELDIPPEHPAQARAALPGGAEMHWT